MVIQLESKVQPLVQFTLCRDGARLPMWDARLDYARSTIPERLLAYGVAVSEEGAFVCAEICPFEPHPLLRQILRSWARIRSNRRRRRIMQWWPEQDEAERIEQSVRLIKRRVGQARLRRELEEIWSVDLPAVTMYTVDGARSWKAVDPAGEKWRERIRKRLRRQKTVDPRDTCLKLSDRITAPAPTDRKRWLTQRLTDRVSGSSIYTPEPQAYSPK